MASPEKGEKGGILGLVTAQELTDANYLRLSLQATRHQAICYSDEAMTETRVEKRCLMRFTEFSELLK
jgi:hypothetical protein